MHSEILRVLGMSHGSLELCKAVQHLRSMMKPRLYINCPILSLSIVRVECADIGDCGLYVEVFRSNRSRIDPVDEKPARPR